MTRLTKLQDEHHRLTLQYHRLLATNSWNQFATHLVRLRELNAKRFRIEDEIARLEEEQAA